MQLSFSTWGAERGAASFVIHVYNAELNSNNEIYCNIEEVSKEELFEFVGVGPHESLARAIRGIYVPREVEINELASHFGADALVTFDFFLERE
jgi:hypothetical protein